MENEIKEKLDEILENTKSVKDAVVKKPKETKEKSTQEKAQAKFTRVGTKFNEKQMLELNAKLELLDTNQSSYIGDLIKKDLENINQSKIDFDEEESIDLKAIMQRTIQRQNERINTLTDELSRCQGELSKYEDELSKCQKKPKRSFKTKILILSFFVLAVLNLFYLVK